jgi:glycosyltransferase involved in cell wall biosynthesis
MQVSHVRKIDFNTIYLMNIISPIATGNGAYIIHKQLSEEINNYRLLGYNPWLTLFPPSLYPIGRGQPCDIIHTTPDYAIFHRRRKTSLVLTFHGYALDPEARAFATKAQRLHYRTDLRLFTKRALLHHDRVTAVSQFIADTVIEDTGFNGTIEVISNGVDTEVFKPTSDGIKDTVTVLFVGNLSKMKGAHSLEKIASKLSSGIKVHYTAGLRPGGNLGHNHKLVNLGNICYSNMPKIYQSADILLVPSTREGFGLAIAEAMACGLPVVASNNSAIPELIINNQGGYLCNTGDVDGYVDAIESLAKNEYLRQAMGVFNRERIISHFSEEKMIANYKRLFNSVFNS